MKILFMPEAGNVNADLYLEEVVSKLTGLYSELLPGATERLMQDTSERLLAEYKRMYTTLFSTPLSIDFKEDNTYSLSHSYGGLIRDASLSDGIWGMITEVEDARSFFSTHVSTVLDLFEKFAVTTKNSHDPKLAVASLIFPGVPKETLANIPEVDTSFRLYLARDLFPKVWEKVKTEIEPQIKILADFLEGAEKCKS